MIGKKLDFLVLDILNARRVSAELQLESQSEPMGSSGFNALLSIGFWNGLIHCGEELSMPWSGAASAEWRGGAAAVLELALEGLQQEETACVLMMPLRMLSSSTGVVLVLSLSRMRCGDVDFATKFAYMIFQPLCVQKIRHFEVHLYEIAWQ